MKNVIEGWKTTLVGVILIAIGAIALSKYDLFELDKPWSVGFIAGGCLLMLAPDRVLNFAFGWLKKKGDA